MCIAPAPADGVQRGLVPAILSRFLSKVRRSWRAARPSRAPCHCLLSTPRFMQGYTLVGMKLMNVSKQLAETHYADLSSKPFFAGERAGRRTGHREGKHRPEAALAHPQAWWTTSAAARWWPWPSPARMW